MAWSEQLGGICVQLGLITANQLEDAVAVQREKGGLLGGIFISMGLLDRKDLSDVIRWQSASRVALRTGHERRKYIRLWAHGASPNDIMRVELKGGSVKSVRRVYLVDLSIGGMRIGFPSSVQVSPGQVFEIRFTFPGCPDGVRTDGKTCWVMPGTEKGLSYSNVAGMEFYRFIPKDKAQLLEFVLHGLTPLLHKT